MPLESSNVSRTFGLSSERRLDRCSKRRQHDRLEQLTFPSHVCPRSYWSSDFTSTCRCVHTSMYSTFSHTIHTGNMFFAIAASSSFTIRERDFYAVSEIFRSYNPWSLRSSLGFMSVRILKNACFLLETRSCVDLNLEQNRDYRLYSDWFL